MSFLSDIFSGNTSNLGNDLAPSNIFSDFGTDIAKNPLLDVGVLLGGGLLTAGLADPALLGLGAAGGAADLSTLGGATAAGIGAGVDPTAAAADAALGLGATTAGDVAGTTGLGYTADTLAAQDLPSWLADPTGALSPGTTSPTTLFDQGTGFANAYSPAATAAPTANLGAAATAAGAPPDLSGGALGTFEGNINTVANPSFGTPGVAGGAAPAAGGPGNVANFFSGATGGAISPNTASVIGQIGGPAIGLGGLGYNLYQGYQNQQAQKAITNQVNATAAQQAAVSTADTAAAQPLINSGTQLTQYLTTGTLPQAFQTQVQQQVDAAKARIIQGYATRGQSTNPSDNSALAQDLANVDAQAQTLQANLESTLSTAGTNMISTANQLLASGASAASISGQLPVMVAQLNLNLSNATSSAISNFAAALNGGKMGAPGGTASPVQANFSQASAQQPLTFT